MERGGWGATNSLIKPLSEVCLLTITKYVTFGDIGEICVCDKMPLVQAKKRQNSANSKRNSTKRAAISCANLFSSSSKYLSNLSKRTESEEIEDVNTDTEDSESLTQISQDPSHMVNIESNISEDFKEDSELDYELKREPDTLSNKIISCRERAGLIETLQDYMSLIGDKWDVILMKLGQSSVNTGTGRCNETRAEKLLDDGNEKILDPTIRSMKDNLIFKNTEKKVRVRRI